MTDIQVATIQDLQAVPTSGLVTGTLAEVLVYNDNYNGFGGGLYYYDSSATGIYDAGLLIPPASGVGRWKRVLPAEVDLRSVDILNATSASTKINALINDNRVESLLIDSIEVPLDAATPVVILNSKKLVFRNKGKISGTGSISGGIVDCDFLNQCLATSLSVSGLQNSKVSVRWFGATPDYSIYGGGATDSLMSFNMALSSTKDIQVGNIYKVKPVVYVPAPPTDNSYYLSDEWIIDAAVEVAGDGMEQTPVCFATGKKGIILLSSSVSVGSRASYIHDLSIYGSFLRNSYGGLFDGSSHGLSVHSNANTIDRIGIKNFKGHGVYCYGDLGINNTNASKNIFSFNVLKDNGGSGFHFEGNDANANLIVGGDCLTNGINGVRDFSGLGNTGVGIHIAGSGVYYANLSYVTHNGHRYDAKQDNINIEPGVTVVGINWEDYWVDRGLVNSDPLPIRSSWGNNIQYYRSGAFYLKGDSQRGTWVGCYSEADQELGINSSNNLVLNGFSSSMEGAGIVKILQGALASSLGFVAINSTIGVEVRMRNSDLSFGFYNPSSNAFYQWKYDGGSSTYLALNDGVSGVIFRGTTNSAGNLTGRSVWPDSINPTWNGLFLKRVGGDGAYRYLTFGVSTPAVGAWAEGDIVLNAGTNTAIVYWKCVAAGSPGVWVAVGANERVYAHYFDDTAQAFNSSITPATVILNTISVENGIDLSSGEITFASEGVYEIAYSAYAASLGNTTENMEIRIQKWNTATSAWEDVRGSRIAFVLNVGEISNAANTYLFSANTNDKIRFAGTASSASDIMLVSGKSDYSFSATCKKI